MKLPWMKKTVFQQSNPFGWTLQAQRFKRYNILKFGSWPKIPPWFHCFVKKIIKMAQIFHFFYQNLSLILFLTCPVSYHSSTLGHIDKEYPKIKKWAKNVHKRLQNYAHPAIASKQSANNPRIYHQITWGEKKTAFQQSASTGWTLSA